MCLHLWTGCLTLTWSAVPLPNWAAGDGSHTGSVFGRASGARTQTAVYTLQSDQSRSEKTLNKHLHGFLVKLTSIVTLATPAHRYNNRRGGNCSSEVVLICLPATKMTHLAHTSRCQDSVSTVDGNRSVLIGGATLLIQDGTQPPVLYDSGCPLLAALLSVR